MPIISNPPNSTNLVGGVVLIPGFGKTTRGHIIVSSFSKTLTASISPTGNETAYHWYSGVFRYTSIARVWRAIFRSTKYITNNRSL